MTILQDQLRPLPAGYGRLPGLAAMEPAGWLVVDEAYGAQMKERARLVAERRGDVIAERPAAKPAARELLAEVLRHLEARPEWQVGAQVRCPDGREVTVDGTDPLATLAALVAEDFAILLEQGGVHVMEAGVICFPSRWTLAEKIGRGLSDIHAPVVEYDASLAARVERILSNVKVGQPMVRANALFHDDPALFQPRAEVAEKGWAGQGARYFRSERQGLMRLPVSGAVVFSIHTTVLPAEALSPEQRAQVAG